MAQDSVAHDTAAFKYEVSGLELWQWWQAARQQAQAAGIDPAEADWVLYALSDVDSLTLKLGRLREQPLVATRLALAALMELWQQRVEKRVPVQYLVGSTRWRDLTLRVSSAVLIPRPETELIVDLALEAVSRSPMAEQSQQGIWVDLGTGSGAIALGLARAFPDARIYAVDISEAALAIARENAALNGLAERIEFRCGSWFEPLGDLRGQLAGVVSNPPYIPTATVQTLEPEVVKHEPALALDGGQDGLDAIRRLVEESPDYLQVGGLCLMEIMAGQGPAVEALMQQGAFDPVQIHLDLAGLDRFGLGVRI